jgi:hypothetical protein
MIEIAGVKKESGGCRRLRYEAAAFGFIRRVPA